MGQTKVYSKDKPIKLIVLNFLFYRNVKMKSGMLIYTISYNGDQWLKNMDKMV